MKLPLHFIARGILFSWGYWYIPRKGCAPATVEEAPIIVANHFSFVEPILVASIYLPMGVSRIENAQMVCNMSPHDCIFIHTHLHCLVSLHLQPIIGPIFRAMQMIFVDRRNPNSRKEVSQNIVDRSRSNTPVGFTLPNVPPILSPMASPSGSHVKVALYFYYYYRFTCADISHTTLYIHKNSQATSPVRGTFHNIASSGEAEKKEAKVID